MPLSIIKTPLAATATTLVILILFNSQFSPSNSSQIDDGAPSNQHNQCKLNVENQLISPMVITKRLNLETKDAQEQPLSAKLGCPDSLKLYFSGFGDKFVIDLEKNKRLISDRYSEQISKYGPQHKYSSPGQKYYTSFTKTIHKNNLHRGQEKFDRNHMFLNLHHFTSNNNHCHYQAIVNDNLNSIAAISVVDNKLLSGFFHHQNHVYYLHANTTNSSTLLSRSPNICNSNSTQDTLPSFDLKLEETTSFNRSRRLSIRGQRSTTSSNSDNYIIHEPFQSNSSSLYVELLVVHDHSQYLEYDKNTTNIAERTMQIVNIMNAFYRQLNIFVALVGVVLWTEKNEIELTNDGDSTLTNFLKYRHEKLLPKYHHDNAQLITSTSFNGSVVGKALKGPICTYEHSGGVNTDHSHSPAIVAVTLAHELGHNLGMEHDEDDKCKCPDEKCIMSSSSSSVHPKYWSSCSIDYLEESRKHGLLNCLVEKPEKVFGPICGNGFVEQGEDCDLGEPLPTYGTSKSRGKSGGKCPDNAANCDHQPAPSSWNPCCDRRTCKFAQNATCAQGPCCDLTRCSVYNGTESKICRKQRGECDLEEVCDGKSEYCPQDVHYHDGIECGPGLALEDKGNDTTRSRAYCFNGHCKSHLSQCNLLWGSSGSVSRDICYDQNVHGNTSGNCGYNRMEKVYNSCDQEDTICGMLHCVHDQGSDLVSSKKAGKLQYGFESASILTVSFFVMSNHAKFYCHGAIIDSGPNVKDPGLVPDGASCGPERMCVNQKCVPLSDVVYKNWCPSDCNGNGICDNQGVCHCYDGTIGTSCYRFFGANFHLSLVLYIIMFFIPLVALFVLALNHYKSEIKIWWFLHNRKQELKNKYRNQSSQQAHQAASRRLGAFVNASDIDGSEKPVISEPIPLNQHNVNRPFYEPVAHQPPNLDPWAETDIGAGNRKQQGPSFY